MVKHGLVISNFETCKIALTVVCFAINFLIHDFLFLFFFLNSIHISPLTYMGQTVKLRAISNAYDLPYTPSFVTRLYNFETKSLSHRVMRHIVINSRVAR